MMDLLTPSYIIGALLTVMLLAVLVAGELSQRHAWISAAAARRWIHAATAMYVVGGVHLFPDAGVLYAFAGVLVLLSVVSPPGSILRVTRRAWGQITFPLALLVLLPFCWEYTGDSGWIPGVMVTTGRVETFLLGRAVGIPEGAGMYALQASFLIVACAHPMAAWVSTSLGRKERSTSNSGSVAFFLVSTLSLLFLNGIIGITHSTGPVDGPVAWGGILVLSAASTVADRLFASGWDGFWIVLITASTTLLFAIHPGRFEDLGIAVLISTALAGFSVWRRWLTGCGATATALLTSFFWWIGGWEMLVPGAVFFVTSSVFSRVGPARNDSPRSAKQVLANGGAGLIAALGMAFSGYTLTTGHFLFTAAFIAVYASAAADTWATEIGRHARNPRMISTGRVATPGVSGAVSGRGLLAAAAGALAVSAASVPLLLPSAGMSGVFLLAGAGFAAGLVDSLLGAFLQARWAEPGTGQPTERKPGSGAELLSGLRWITNDTVNLICTVTGAFLGAVLVYQFIF